MAIGDSLSATETVKAEFARGLVKELNDLFLHATTAFPDRQVVDDLISDLEAMRLLAEKLDQKTKESPFVDNLLTLASRRISSKKYNAVDAVDIWALTERAGVWAQNIRFRNKKSGPDTRLPLTVALIIAENYKKKLKKIPGIGGTGKRATTLDSQETPYQRICNVVADKKGIKIGRPVQVEAVRLLKKGEQPAPFFKGDVQSLPEKKMN